RGDKQALLIEDWTGEYDGLDELRDFEYITDFIVSRIPRRIIASTPHLENRYCRGCKGCTAQRLQQDQF
ncbi:hypothetical protein PMAYCL1PPCAC_30568, partial [Pristionchus mayeri]